MKHDARPSSGKWLGTLASQLASLLLFLAVWEALVKFGVYRFSYIPSVTQVSASAAEYLFSPRFLRDAWPSAYRIVGAWACAVALGVPLGLLIGWKRGLRDLLLPVIEITRPIPPIAWIPAGILFFPSVEASVVFICFMGAFFPLVVNTITGVDRIDQTYFRAARCLGASEFQVFRDVVVRAAMPAVAVGAAIGMGLCCMALVAGEMIAGEHGLGYMIWEAYSMAQYPLIIVGMIGIGALGASLSWMIRVLGRRLAPWQKA